MPSMLFNSAPDDLARGNINFSADSFKVMLVGPGYIPNKDTHTKRSDVTNEVSGTGYTAGGVAVVPTVTKNTATDTVVITFPAVSLPDVVLAGVRQAVYYKARGGAASADELIGVADFGADFTTGSGGTFNVGASTWTMSNPG